MHEAPWNRIGGDELCAYYFHRLFSAVMQTKLTSAFIALLLGILTPNPSRRMEMSAILSHPWVSRPSQVLRRGPAALAEELSAGLRASGDLDVAEPQADVGGVEEEDVRMGTAPMMSQFTQSLVLFVSLFLLLQLGGDVGRL
jgi:serine/threonine-protein kinase Chk1